MPALDDLKAFETEIDATVQNLSLLQLPLNAVLAAAYVVIDGFFHGARNKPAPSDPRELAGYASAARLSYLLPVLSKCPTALGGVTVADSILALCEQQREELRLLLEYGHFCEIMPEVHRGLYDVNGGDGKYALTHPSQEVANGEARDVVLNELALPFYLQSKVDQAAFDALAETLPKVDLSVMAPIVGQLFGHYAEHAYEAPLLSDEIFRTATGATYADVNRFRSGWAAVADFALGMAAAVGRKAHKAGLEIEKNGLYSELVEWVAVLLQSKFLGGLVIAITGLEPSKFDALMRLFSIDAKSGRVRHAGDGFFPPIVEYDSAYQFNPDVLRIMLSGRNVPYALNRVDKKKFDNSVSQDLD
jgi:hypothetical protein